ncbi:MAG: hypothetical protein ABEJ62_01370 [Candidatus Nanohaloarchaea archaeon]
MTDAVKEKIGEASPATILDTAHRHEDYQKIPGDDMYEVYRGPDLLIVGVPGSGIYAEEMRNENDYRYDFVKQEPWKEVRETRYSVEGEPAAVKKQLYTELDRKNFFHDSHSLDDVERWIDRNEGEAVVELRGDEIVLREESDSEVPDLGGIEGIEIEEVSTWTPEQAARDTI